MSKSLGNLVFVADLRKEWDPRAIRLAHRRAPLPRLVGVGRRPACPRPRRGSTLAGGGRGRAGDGALDEVRAALDDDLDTPRAVAAIDAAAAAGRRRVRGGGAARRRSASSVESGPPRSPRSASVADDPTTRARVRAASTRSPKAMLGARRSSSAWRIKVDGLDERCPPRAGDPVPRTTSRCSTRSSCRWCCPAASRFVGKAEYMDDWKTQVPVPGHGHDPDRPRRRQRQRARRSTRPPASSTRGELFGIYPEGTRSRDGVLHKGHTGPARLALRTGVPIIPVGIVGTARDPAARRQGARSRSSRARRASAARSTSTATATAPTTAGPAPDHRRGHVRDPRAVGPGVRRRVRHRRRPRAAADRRRGQDARRRRSTTARATPAARRRKSSRPRDGATSSGTLGSLRRPWPMADIDDHACPTVPTRDAARRHHRGRPGRVDRPAAGQGGGDRRRSTASSATSSAPLRRRRRGRRSSPTDSDAGCYTIRHSTAHVLAQAVLDLFPGATFAIGPPDRGRLLLRLRAARTARTFTPDDLDRIEARMREIIAEDQPFVRDEIADRRRRERCSPTTRTSSRSSTAQAEDPTSATRAGLVRTYENPPAVHRPLPRPARAAHGPASATSSSCGWPAPTGGATRSNPMLQRIYGTAWASKKALDEHLHRLEEAEKRDHRKLGVELDLFSFPDELGGGLAVWHPKGGIVRQLMEDYCRAAPRERRATSSSTRPHITKAQLFEIVGPPRLVRRRHVPADGAGRRRTYYPKPMNCPFHMLIYRVAAAVVPRAAAAAVRVRHGVPLRAVRRRARPHARARLHPGRQPHLLHARAARRRARVAAARSCSRLLRDVRLRRLRGRAVDPAAEKSVGDRRGLGRRHRGAARRARGRGARPTRSTRASGAFYGPKIDVQVRDAIGRTWQLSTIQVDFQHARPLRPRVRRRRQPAPPPDHDPPRAVRLDRAVLRRARRALRRGVPDVAGAGAGAGAAGGATTTTRYAVALVDRLQRRRASGPTWSRPTSSSATASARPSSRSCPTCSSSATTTSATARSASTRGAATVGARRATSTTSSTGCAPNAIAGAAAVTLERLWAGWRAAYCSRDIGGVGRGRVGFTGSSQAGDPDAETYVLGEGRGRPIGPGSGGDVCPVAAPAMWSLARRP